MAQSKLFDFSLYQNASTSRILDTSPQGLISSILYISRCIKLWPFKKKLTHLFSTVDRRSSKSSDQTLVLEIFHGLHPSPPRDLLDQIGLFWIKMVRTRIDWISL